MLSHPIAKLSGMSTLDARLAASAAERHGVVDGATAASLDASVDQVKRRARGGMLGRLHPDVFVVGGAPPTAEQRLVAACLAAGAEGPPSPRTAGGGVELSWGPPPRP